MARSSQTAPRRTSLDTAATVAAPRTGQRLVVNVAGRVEHQLAQEDERPQLRRDEQGLTTDPSQPRLDSQLLLRERRRVDERPPPEIGLRGTQTTEQIAQHPLEEGVVVDRQSVRGDFRPETIGIAVAQLVLVTDGRRRRPSAPPRPAAARRNACRDCVRGNRARHDVRRRANDGKKARSAPDAGTARHRRDRSLRPRRIVG